MIESNITSSKLNSLVRDKTPNQIVVCRNCGTHVCLNDEKHKTRPKLCFNCKAVVEPNHSWLGKLAEIINNAWRQTRKKQKDDARQRFMEKMRKENPLLTPNELSRLIQQKSYKRFKEEGSV